MELIKMDVMKKYTIIAAMAAALLSVGCAKKQTLPDDGTVLKASLSTLTKTSIEGVKVSWSEGDIINVNGTNSSALAEAAATAEFEFRTALTSPYKALYPVSIYKDAETVTLPALVDITKQQIVPLAGYAETGNEIAFQALTAFLKVSLTGETSKTLKDITLKSLGGEQISGDFTLAYPALTLSGASAAEADQQVKVKVNMALSATPLVVYIPIPAGTYASGYQVDFLDADGKVMRQTVSARTIKAGELREMPALVFEPNVADDPNIGGIPDAKELSDFAAAVNEGRLISRWINKETGAVELLADIDLGGADWTPIGNGSVTTSHAITGAFTGVFDGKGHTVDNFKVSIPASGTNVAGGLFGIVSGATLKNLTIGDKAVIKTSSNSGFVTLGGVVGFAGESTLENLDSKALLANDGGKDNTRLVIGGTIGTMFSSETTACTASNIQGHASFNVVNNVNTKNGATGFIVGGVIGFMDGKDYDVARTTATNIVNYSTFSVQATRTAGVIGTINSNAHAEGCINYGNISCTDIKASNSRPSGIVSAMGSKTTIKGCVNYGDISFAVSGDTTHGYCAGVVGQTNDGNEYLSYIDGCASYGKVQSDMYFGNKYMGIICADFASKKVTVQNCILGGAIGPYTPTAEAPVVTLTSENFSNYYTLEAESRYKNIVKFIDNSFGTRP